MGATIFPHNIGLGATRDADLVARIGRITATELIATGVRWTFAPCVAVPQDFCWGRTYEGYSQDTNLVAELGAACVRGLQCGGWTIEWMGKPGDITPGTTLLKAIKGAVSTDTIVDYNPDGRFSDTEEVAEIGLVVLSERPYAEGTGDRADLTLPVADVALIERVRPRCRRLAVILFSGRPLIITDHLEKFDAFIAAWLPGTEGQGIADVLFGDYPFTGRLAYSWPKRMDQIPLKVMAKSGDDPLFPFGFGLS